MIADDGSLHCWGLDDFGQLGNGPDGAPPEGDLVEVAEAGPWRWVSTGPAHACAVDAAAALWCWGSNEFGQLGNGSAGTDADPTTADSDVPIEVAGEQQWSSVAVGEAHSCAIDTDHQAWCWGPNASGSLGVGDQEDRSQPTAVVLPDL